MLYVLIILLTVSFILWMLIPYRRNVSVKKKKARLDTIANLAPIVKDAFIDISAYYSYSHFITESERIVLVKKYAYLLEKVSSIIHTKELSESPQSEYFYRLHKALSDSQGYKASNNEHFIDNQLKDCAKYFDTVLTYPLDQQQREAIVSLEDNVLVISSAGSGKTMTTVGKVRYLIDIQKVSPEKILLITFTRKAAESLSERLGEKDLKCRTFHKLALDIIGEATGEKPTITEKDFSVQVYHRLCEENDSFRRAIVDYIVRARYKMKDQFEYASMQEYMQDRQKHGVQVMCTQSTNMTG